MGVQIKQPRQQRMPLTVNDFFRAGALRLRFRNRNDLPLVYFNVGRLISVRFRKLRNEPAVFQNHRLTSFKPILTDIVGTDIQRDDLLLLLYTMPLQ